MIETARKPASIGELLIEEFLTPLDLTQAALADAMGVTRQTVSDLCRGRRAVTVHTALMLGRALGTSAEFWLNAQRRIDLWNAANDPDARLRLSRVKPLQNTAA
jgi:addiction module HigA family antidote